MVRKVKLQVDGMGCEGCVLTVIEKLKAVPGVKDAKVTLQPPEAIVTFESDQASLVNIMDATVGAGYRLRLKEEFGAG